MDKMLDLLMRQRNISEAETKTEMKNIRDRFHDIEDFMDKEFGLSIGVAFDVLLWKY
ncbi:MAG: hypothetical protein HFG53_13415 [Lachnospiraceae bacterium]|jgi:hypothetical protein|nr:hypothetical protein [Lachnospiraceae bacterium]